MPEDDQFKQPKKMEIQAVITGRGRPTCITHQGTLYIDQENDGALWIYEREWIELGGQEERDMNFRTNLEPDQYLSRRHLRDAE